MGAEAAGTACSLRCLGFFRPAVLKDAASANQGDVDIRRVQLSSALSPSRAGSLRRSLGQLGRVCTDTLCVTLRFLVPIRKNVGCRSALSAPGPQLNTACIPGPVLSAPARGHIRRRHTTQILLWSLLVRTRACVCVLGVEPGGWLRRRTEKARNLLCPPSSRFD